MATKYDIRRVVLRVSAILLLGVVLTYVNGWMCWAGAWKPFHPSEITWGTSQLVWPTIWPRDVPEDWPDRPDQVGHWSRGGSSVSVGMVNNPEDPLFLTSFRHGWPIPAIAGEYKSTLDIGEEWSCAVDLASLGIESRGYVGTWAPLCPAFPGFLVNLTLACASIIAVFVVARLVRRNYRRQRGLCERCGYQISGGGCPECGHGLDIRQQVRV